MEITMKQDRDRWIAEVKRLLAENRVLLERVIQAQNDAARWRERMLEAERYRFAKEYECANCRCGVDD